MNTEKNTPAPSSEDTEDEEPVERLASLLPGTMHSQTLVLLCILILMLLWSLYIARAVAVPILIAIFLSLLLSPLVRKLKRLRIPEWLGAALVLLGLFIAMMMGLALLAAPAVDWAGRIPEGMERMERIAENLRRPFETLQQAREEIERLTEMGAEEGEDQVRVSVQEFDIGQFFVVNTAALLAQTGIVLVLLYFMLATGDTFLRRFVRAQEDGTSKRQAVSFAHRMQEDISAYLGTIALINLGLGLVTALVMWLLGLPNALLWGALAGILNFIPYLGAMLTVVILALVALMSFDEIIRILLPPLAFIVLTNLEANIITPATVGRRLTLTPALVALSLVFWGWMWGIAGALLAVPLLVVIKIITEHVQALRQVSVLLGKQENEPPRAASQAARKPSGSTRER
ncbi:AI-2E family transporter [Telmatospirillum sp. J64-1]|uniref:AI-2E family transporter n=1 Tax=Telmatospirillum sp. J64-1 TaxID=2502183 RepID=UPI00115D436E|nr:AI-2E family transporter [Telmatospirillum sp. J64-1]